MTSRPKPGNLLNFHRPKRSAFSDETSEDTDARQPFLKPESKQCIKNLASYSPARHWQELIVPKSRRAAVLVALFIGRKGDLYVLLSRRASTLRTYAGDTSLPGGKWEPGDANIEWTARREAFEEIGLPLDRQRVPLLCVLEPFLAGNQLLVTPVVVLVLDKTITPILNSSEVASLFSHPLIGFLQSEPPFPLELETLEYKYHTHTDIDWGKYRFRMHRFLTGREAGGTKPVFGLTASILIRVASIGYGRKPDFEVNAPGQPTHEERIVDALKHHEVFRSAAIAERMDPDALAAKACKLLPRKGVLGRKPRVVPKSRL
ncbi:hypothetical protein K474DRAFT_1181426 [Panus rudis PR-1116 ss-1]|nr:hypothetical protein K474DRAFT_1181426 [Panus rudis PR-1116 ss-1]